MTSRSTMRWLGHTGIVLALTICMPSAPLAEAFGIPDFLEFGECAETTNQADLDLTRYSGVWFAQEMVPNEYSQIESCSMTNYTWKGDMMKVVERGLSSEKRKLRQNSLIRHDVAGDEGDYVVDAEGVPSAPFQVIATDYENYACVHSCMSFMGFRAAFSWIYTRKPNADHSYVVLCRDLFSERGVDPTPLQPMKQGKDCPYMEKLPTILAYSDSVQKAAKAQAQSKVKTTKAPKVEVVSTSPDATLPEDTSHPEETERRLQEEESRILREMEDERQTQQEERRRMEEERQREQEERRIMEEERRREQEERRRMEEERRAMEGERTKLEEERRTMEHEREEEKEQITELREDVRAEIRRNHRGNRHRSGTQKDDAESNSNQISTNVATILLAMGLSALMAL